MKIIKQLFLIVALLLSTIGGVFATEYDLVVDRAGRGDFRNVGDAIDSIGRIEERDKWLSVYIMSGTYKEKLCLTNQINKVMFIGEDRYKTVITYDDHANIEKMGTFLSFTFRIGGTDLLFKDITIENNAQMLGQAVAVHLEGDRVVFNGCRFLGNQDTLYAGEAGSKYYFRNCYIEGTTDFIFGPATCWFEKCEILCKKSSYITAANTPQDIKYGFVFNNCTVRSMEGVEVFLGRPWRAFAMTLFMNCSLEKGIRAEGWDNWRNAENEKTARYAEYNNSGEGSDLSQRVAWSRVLTDQEAQQISITSVLSGEGGWDPLSVE